MDAAYWWLQENRSWQNAADTNIIRFTDSASVSAAFLGLCGVNKIIFVNREFMRSHRLQMQEADMAPAPSRYRHGVTSAVN